MTCLTATLFIVMTVRCSQTLVKFYAWLEDKYLVAYAKHEELYAKYQVLQEKERLVIQCAFMVKIWHDKYDHTYLFECQTYAAPYPPDEMADGSFEHDVGNICLLQKEKNPRRKML